ncbi:MAG: hypothetical protein EPO25_01210 [Gammaproteobacteria bacterium]|jgi:hypothetical protein|nr:MAG: hypothetical protein EPO25_01210 [Gammaproteobacteria bacterium]
MPRPPELPDPTSRWPGGPGPGDDPTPLEAAVAALKFGAILAAALTITLIYLGTYAGIGAERRPVSLAVVVAFAGPSLLAGLRAAWRRRRQRRTKDANP